MPIHSSESKRIYSNTIRALIVDMDGVLWRGQQPIGDLPAVFQRISDAGLKIMLATNNSTRTPEEFLSKLASFGVHLESWQVINSSQATAQYIQNNYPPGSPLFVVGEEGLIQALEEKGFFHNEQGAKIVVAGMDRQLTFEKLRRATLLIRGGADFIGTNPDRTFPTPDGLIPGTGAVLAAIEAATDIKPKLIGKPAPEMYRVALDRLQSLPQETLVIGDRLETDIAGGQQLGSPTALVLSGVSSLSQAKNWQPAPELIAEDLDSVIAQLIDRSA